MSIFIWVNQPLSATALGSHFSRLDANEIFLIFWSPPTQVGLIIFLPSRPPQMRKNRARRSKWKRGEYFTSCDDRLSSPAWAIHLSLGKKSLWLRRRACGRHTGGEWEVERASDSPLHNPVAGAHRTFGKSIKAPALLHLKVDPLHFFSTWECHKKREKRNEIKLYTLLIYFTIKSATKRQQLCHYFSIKRLIVFSIKPSW